MRGLIDNGDSPCLSWPSGLHDHEVTSWCFDGGWVVQSVFCAFPWGLEQGPRLTVVLEVEDFQGFWALGTLCLVELTAGPAWS